MPLTLSFAIEGEQQLLRRFAGIEKEMHDWTPAFKESIEALKDIFGNKVFETRGGAIGEQWEALDPEYQRWKSMHYPGKGILEASGAMRRSFETMFKADQAAIWNTASYFAYHQSNQPRSKMPRRVMMKLAEEQRQIVVKIFHTLFVKKLKK